jgi:hypothetical protein
MQGAIRIDLSTATPDDNLPADDLGGKRAGIPASGAGECPDTVEIPVVLLRYGWRCFFHGGLRVMVPGKKCHPAVSRTGIGGASPRQRIRRMARNKKQSTPQPGHPPHQNEVVHGVHLRNHPRSQIFLPRTNWIASDRDRSSDATRIRDQRGQSFPARLCTPDSRFPKIRTKRAS